MPLTPEHHAAIDTFTSTDHKGNKLDKKELLAPHPMMARIILARAKELTDQERQVLRSILTPQTMPVLKKMVPELEKVMENAR